MLVMEHEIKNLVIETTKNMLSILEDNMIIEILLRLPIRSVARFKFVSKKWNHYISYDSYFRNKYRQLSNGCPLFLGLFHQRILPRIPTFPPHLKDDILFLPSSSSDEGKSLLCKQKSITTTITTTSFTITSTKPSPSSWLGNAHPFDESLSFIPARNQLYIVGTSNGCLLCCEGQVENLKYYIVNPITKKWISLPTPKKTTPFVCIAFFSENENFTHYKIFRVLTPPVMHITIEMLLSSSNGQWKEFNPVFTLPLELDYHFNGVISQSSGLVFFKARINTIPYKKGVVSFDYRQELPSLQMEKIILPGEAGEGYRSRIDPSPTSHKGYQDAFGQTNGLIVYVLYRNQDLDMWVLDEHEKEWYLKYRLDNINITSDRYPGIVPLRAWKFYEVVTFHPFDPRLILIGSAITKRAWFNIENSEMESVHDVGSFKSNFRPYVWPSWPPSFPLFK